MEPFPVWLRIGHLINVIFLVLLIRSGVEILSAHPKLYFRDDTTPGKEWLKFTKKKMPKDRPWTTDDEMESFNSAIALPGHSMLGMGRHWHFFAVIFWPLNGLVYYALLFATGTWRTLIPTSWSVFPQAWNAILTFLSGRLPEAGNPFDPAQQLSYFAVVFILGPLMIATGAAKSPAVAARFPGYTSLFGGRQRARSFHFVVMVLFVLFIAVHLTLVLVDRFRSNMANIVIGGGEISVGLALVFFLLYLGVIVAINIIATRYSIERPRTVQRALGALVESTSNFLMHRLASRQRWNEKKVSPFFRINGRPPETAEYRSLAKDDFASWSLKLRGMVETPLDLSLAEIKSMKKSTQTTEHSCIQGWTAAAEWGGVRVSDLAEICKPAPEVRYVVFRSLAYGDLDEYGHGDPTTKFYEAIPLEMAKQEQTILAYEMNNLPLSVPHGAPLRLRVEVQYGYKMVKWLDSVEFVDDLGRIGAGQGGHREDSKYFAWQAWI